MHFGSAGAQDWTLPNYRLPIEFVAALAVAVTAHLGGFLSGVNGLSVDQVRLRRLNDPAICRIATRLCENGSLCLSILAPVSRLHPTCWSMFPSSSPRTTTRSLTFPCRRREWRSVRRGIADRRSTLRSMRTTFLPSRRRSANTAKAEGTSGPLFLAKDTHALSEPAFKSALEVLLANGVEVMVDTDAGLHADAGAVARGLDVQPRAQEQAGGRHRDHAVAQSAGRWRLQVQPDQRRPGGHYGDQVD